MKSRIAAGLAAATASVVVLSAVAAAPANAAGINIGVAPSPNGYVMANVPTQIAVNGNASVYRMASGKWMMLGKTTKSRAIPVTFTEPGIHTLRIKSGKTSKTVKVGVYQRYSEGNNVPTNYAGVVLPSLDFGSDKYEARAAAGCVAVDVGYVNETGSDSEVVSILSSAAPAVTFEVGPKSADVRLGVPVSGDALVEVPAKDSNDDLGVVWTCLSAP